MLLHLCYYPKTDLSKYWKLFNYKLNHNFFEMKKLYFFIAALAVSMAFTSCGNSKKQSEESSTAGQVNQALDVSKALYVEEILKNAEKEVGKEITLKGFVTHTCKHSGRRCFVMGNDQKTSIRVEAIGNIGGFNRELIGSELVIKGILRENKLTKEYIDQAEEELKEKQGKESNGETCDAELSNIENMRKWMKENNKDYYSIYFVEGTDYEVVE